MLIETNSSIYVLTPLRYKCCDTCYAD